MPASNTSSRDHAQELMWEAMDVIDRSPEDAAALCQRALNEYPDCVDAHTMLAGIEELTARDYVERLQQAVAAGRRDLGPRYFKQERGHFWLIQETRPFMRAMAQLAYGMLEWGTVEMIEASIDIQEEMLDLNPNDNQGMRDTLTACYLLRKWYDDAGRLLKQYENDDMAVPRWARVLLAHATGDIPTAIDLLALAREQNPHVEQYFTGQKRRPRTRDGYYTPGEETEAVFCADVLGAAWNKHPKSKRWLRQECGVD